MISPGLAAGACSGTSIGWGADASTLSAGLESGICAASALTVGTELAGSPGLNSIPEASHPAASTAIVPAIQYERRMITSQLRQSKCPPIQRRQRAAFGARSAVSGRSALKHG
jgi:hypothetical protein